jgi:leucyl-tRNA synthetase
MDYAFREIEKKWQQRWQEQHTYRSHIQKDKPKYYVLDMFPYPSGAGLHVGHPLGYIATDIVARYKRLKGFNVLHPMGFDSFGLPAEQYAIQTGQHPAITTEANIETFKKQLRNIGFSYDWEREVRTSSPDFYKWTQWIFIQLFHSWFNTPTQQAASIQSLIEYFEKQGTIGLKAHREEKSPDFTADEWKSFSEKRKQEILLHYRLAYLDNMTVNWCPALGTVLANDEVKDGVSERGGYPVIRKEMQQWAMRITAYAQRLLDGLEEVDWPEPLKEMQRNWIGKSIGAELDFQLLATGAGPMKITVFTTRIDTIFGVTYLVLAPEHPLVAQLITPAQAAEANQYIEMARNRSERERQSDVKTVSGAFTGSYALNPFTGAQIPVWIADYVLAGYGTGAVMGVPSSDDRDHRFASHFNLPIVPVIEGTENLANPTEVKYGKLINAGFLNGLDTEEAIETAIRFAEERGVGKRRVNFKMRDAIFARQRYWGEPIPVYYQEGMPYTLPEEELPLLLPEVDKYLPTEDGDPPLGRAKNWEYQGYPLELNTMPGWAGSSWYWYRYMDPQNEASFVSKEAQDYWQDVDLYLGGAEHATGHLLYSRFWNHFLYDLGLTSCKEYARKLINQGMIQGRSNFVYRLKSSEGEGHHPVFVSYNLIANQEVTALHVDVNLVENDLLDTEGFLRSRPDLEGARFVLEEDKYVCGTEVEKMSKRYANAVNPDDVVERYGADTLRLYEMFLGPLEVSKPWDTKGIDGTFRFLRKLWRLFYDEKGNWLVSTQEPTPAEYKVLHKTIKKVEEDIERFSFNTAVSAFMVCVNELKELGGSKQVLLEDLLVILSPYAPHVAEELWEKLGHTDCIFNASFPSWKQEYIQEDAFEYPVSVNGKVRAKISFSLDTPREEIERSVLASEAIQKWLEGKEPKKVIVVEKKIVNVVV